MFKIQILFGRYNVSQLYITFYDMNELVQFITLVNINVYININHNFLGL